MEFEFGKHFKDATNLLLMMDHDSGYDEGVEATLSNADCSSSKTAELRRYEVTDNFLFSEDALLEKPDVSLNWTADLPYDIPVDDHEEARKLFFSPEVIENSVSSQTSSLSYSGLKNNSSTNSSAEIPLQQSLVCTEALLDEMSGNIESTDNDVITLRASESDMSLEEQVPTQIITNGPVCMDSRCAFNSGFSDSIKPGFKNYLYNNKQDSYTCSGQDTLDVVSEDQSCDVDANTQDLYACIVSEQDSSNTVISHDGQTVRVSCDTPPISNSTLSPSVRKTPIKTLFPKNPGTSTLQPNKRLTLVFSKADKENSYCVKRKYPSLTPEKQLPQPVDSNISPDLFDDDMSIERCLYFDNKPQGSLEQPSSSLSDRKEKCCDKLDEKLLKRINKGMSGVLPPPSVTVVKISANDILCKWQENKNLWFWEEGSKEKHAYGKGESLNSSEDTGTIERKSLLLNVTLQDAQKVEWPDVLDKRCHGLYYNCSKTSEEIVDLCDKYQKRFVGAETQSTCTVFEIQSTSSPSKRKSLKPRWGGGKSPGRRLSHLARRRITFSSANLQASGSSLAGSRARQILVDAKKIDLLNRRKSPRKSPRKTPRKTPNRSPKIKTRTPSSSAKKKLALRFRKLTGEIEKSGSSTGPRALFKSPEKSVKSEGAKGTKRALFQSPSRHSSSLFNTTASRIQNSGEKPQLRRALFVSPSKTRKSPLKQALRFGFEKKRKRSEFDDLVQPSKFARSMSMDVKPASANVSKAIPRTQSELNVSLNRQNELTEQHKKKLLWAVSGALQSQNITNTHPQWKVFASVLARVTRRFYFSQMASSGIGRPEGGTSERMHRIARYHVISVIKGKTADEIVNDYLRSRAKVQRPQGYVPPDDFKIPPSTGKESVLQDRANTLESWEKRRMEQHRTCKQPLVENKVERIRKVINFGDDN